MRLKRHSVFLQLQQRNKLLVPMSQWGASLVAQMVKNLPAVQETWVWLPGQEYPLEKGMATHSEFLSGEFCEQRSLVGCSPWDHKESDTTEWLTLSLFHSNPCLGLGCLGKLSQKRYQSLNMLLEPLPQISTKGSFIYQKPVNKLQMKGGKTKKGENFIFDFYSELII